MNILLVVDLQPEFGRSHLENYNEVLEYIAKNARDYDDVYATVFRNEPHSQFEHYLDYKECRSPAMLDFISDRTIIKHGYGLDDYSVLDVNNTYTIIGCDTDACVLKVATDLFDLGYEFSVLPRYCFSSGGHSAHAMATELMRRNLGRAIK